MDVSVIIPLYNAEKYIAKALDSCIDIPVIKEIIVIDDGHPDKGSEIVQKYSAKYSYIKLLQHPGNINKGAGASRNLGIKNAKSEYIAFLDADDFYLPNRFTSDVQIFSKHTDAEGCYNALGIHFYSKKAKTIFQRHFRRDITTVSPSMNPTPENLIHGLSGMINDYGYFSLDCLTIKRDALIENNLLFNEELRVHQDTDFIIKLAYYCNIYPSEIRLETAKRGVHEENRITANFNKARKEKNKNRYLQWKSLNNWAKKEEIKDKEISNHFKNKLDYFRMMMIETPSSKKLFLEIIKNPSLIKNPQYATVHYFYLRKWWRLPRAGAFRLRNVLLKFL